MMSDIDKLERMAIAAHSGYMSIALKGKNFPLSKWHDLHAEVKEAWLHAVIAALTAQSDSE